MQRILIGDSWYDPISSRSIVESEYEQSIFRYAKHLFPGYLCARFNALVTSEYGSVRADMVLIDKEYRGWTIIEAELEHHSLSRHVEPQMQKLVNGLYDETHAAAILGELPELNQTQLTSLVCNQEPDFLVIVPKEEVEWRASLSNIGVRLAVIQVYADHLGKRVVVYSGDTPESWDEGYMTSLSRDGFLPRAFRLDTPSAISDSDSLSINYQGFFTTWRVVRAQRTAYILPNGSLDLEEDGKYVILRNSEGSLVIEMDSR